MKAGPESNRYWTPILVGTGLLVLGGCFQTPFSTDATISVGAGKNGAAILTTSTDSNGRSSAAFNPNATYSQALTASSGAIAGTTAIFPPGALSISTELMVETAASLAGSAALSDLGIAAVNTILSAGTAVIIRPATEATLLFPMALSIPLPAAAGLTGKYQDGLDLSNTSITVLARIWDPKSSSLKTILLPPSEVTVTDGLASFSSAAFGSFQTATFENPVAQKLEATSSEPIVNGTGVSVVTSSGITSQSNILSSELKPPFKATDTQYSVDPATGLVTALFTGSEATRLTECQLQIRNSNSTAVIGSARGQIPDTSDNKQTSYFFEAQLPKTVHGKLDVSATCTAADGRTFKMPWAHLTSLCEQGRFDGSCPGDGETLHTATVENLPATSNVRMLTLTATGRYISFYKWRLEPEGTAEPCVSTSTFSDPESITTPFVVDLSSRSDGTVHVCLLGGTNHGRWQDVPDILTWNLDTSPPVVQFNGLPANNGFSGSNAIDATVSSPDVVAYRYKLGVSTSTDCRNEDGYSDQRPVTWPVSAALTGFPIGQSVKFCAIGSDAAGNWQNLSNATETTWTRQCDPGYYGNGNECHVAGRGYYVTVVNGVRLPCTNPLPENAVWLSETETNPHCSWQCTGAFGGRSAAYDSSCHELGDPLIQIDPGSHVDNAGYPISLPAGTQFWFNGVNYGTGIDGTNQNGGAFIGTNSYLTFGAESTAFDNFSPATPGKGIFFDAQDKDAFGIWKKTEMISYQPVHRISVDASIHAQPTDTRRFKVEFFPGVPQYLNLRMMQNGSGVREVKVSDGTNYTLQATTTEAAETVFTLKSEGNGTNWTQESTQYPPTTAAAAYYVTCPEGSVVAGQKLRAGWWINNVGVRCAQIAQSGGIAADRTDGTYTVGAPGGADLTHDCPTGSYVNRIMTHGEGGDGQNNPEIMRNLKFGCIDSNDGNTTWLERRGNDGGSPEFYHSCPTGYGIQSIFGLSTGYGGKITRFFCVAVP